MKWSRQQRSSSRGSSKGLLAPCSRYGLMSICLFLVIVEALSARTITLTGEDLDEMAVLSAKTPRQSWASMLSATGVNNAEGSVLFFSDMAILLRFPVDQVIPKGQRITKAELSLEAYYLGGTLSEIHVRRLLAEWGTGVCHQYRMTYPKKIEWTQAGGRGGGTDRANKDTGVFKIPKVGEYTVDVTEDIDLWYTGGAVNRGWILAIEQNTGPVYLYAPYGPHDGASKKWKLQITFEPR